MNGKELLFRLFYVQRYTFFLCFPKSDRLFFHFFLTFVSLKHKKRLQASCSKPFSLLCNLVITTFSPHGKSCQARGLAAWRKSPSAWACAQRVGWWAGYIMPPMPGAPIGISGLSSLASQMTHSVVRNMPAMEAAFSRATRQTLAGSMMPDSRRFS